MSPNSAAIGFEGVVDMSLFYFTSPRDPAGINELLPNATLNLTLTTHYRSHDTRILRGYSISHLGWLLSNVVHIP